MLLADKKTGDLRVRRTRHLLTQAFMELLMERGFQAFTVQDIADKAMVNRATFYDHFVDKYALLEYSMRDRFEKTLHNKLPEAFTFNREHLRLLIVTVCEFLSNINGHCAPVDKQLLPLFETQITTLVQEIILNWLRASEVKGTDTSPTLKAAITTWAIYGAAFQWSQESRREEAAHFADRVLPIITAIMQQPL